ncbi:transcription-repair coupling factor [Alkalibacterium kapii]|uniref:Transcription-repair-coupling factor n=1 Tax=Alkalibacterium kapii TaxID=426704 RepID=A0A511ATU7_9LACT|nr:transcription-repair coupling factor [Alkalibacterium kapii]GEK91620.1 transcription-repair-coupling factor [Alkalibacterium kapii]
MPLLHRFLSNKPSFQEIFKSLPLNERQLITGLAGSARTLLLQSMLEEKQKPLVVFTQNIYHANQMISDLSGLVPDEQLYLFSVDDMIHAEMAVASPEARADRVKTLDFLLKDEPGIIVVPLAGARKILPDPSVFKKAELSFALGDEIELDDLMAQLTEMGYKREQKVTSPGDYSIRGGIVDVYPLTEEYPVRMELFDIEVDSLRYFDSDSQRSSHNIDNVRIIPATDSLLPIEDKEEILNRFDKAFKKSIKRIKENDRKEELTENVTSVMDAIRAETYDENLVKYTDLLYKNKATVLDYVPEDAIFVMDEYPRIIENEALLDEEEAEWIMSQLSNGTIMYDQTFSVSFRESLKQVTQPQLYFSLFQKGMKGLKLDTIHNFQYRTMQKFFGQMPLVKTEMERWAKQDYTVVVMTENQERAEKVYQTLRDFEIESSLFKDGTIETGRVQVIRSSVQTGFELPQQKLAVLTEKELFNRMPKKKPRRQNITNAERLKSYSELEKGDYVVHVNHGIGQFTGMETMEINGVHQDYMTIIYSDTSKLFIPVSQLNLLQKYVSSEGKTPKLNKLSGTAWAKTKKRVAAQVEDIADDLIELYAVRENEEGYAFSPDDAYQKEFDDAFPYTETNDQLRTIEEVKKDMEKPKPMDRLLVGDVGYGKTEVAMRAAFKAIQDGKQVAFLVPTTVLAQQHYETMRERFTDFPVEIGLLSRFRTGQQLKNTVDDIRKGKVDVVVGTHRVLSKDIVFQDLGLLIVDEEQRFGVKHKERLKQLKNEVDVLTLTATPIPRTLHMSMLGVRDLSVIETPPANRYPVQTYVMEMNGPVVQESIKRELARGGQVFYLHNRVKTIDQRANEIQQLVPEARIAVAHGQMSENQLENVLYQFVQGEFDVIVTTTIIETGVDIPNVNTLIVEDADRMGLSQLYQLRGRVGRSSRIAYAYFMHQPNKVLTEVSEKRLQAIKDFTDLGSGFKIAMRDLSIRGAGNLLGQQQHGFIDSVGFDLYSQMLSEAVARKRGDKHQTKTHVEIDLALDAYLPGSYVADERQKIELYKRIRQFSSEEDYVELQDELIDRFGEYPQSVSDLLSVGLLKMYSETALIETIKREGFDVTVSFSSEGTDKYPLPEVFRALKDISLKTDMQSKEKLSIVFRLTKQMKSNEWLDSLVLFSKNCAEYRVETEKQEDEQAAKETMKKKSVQD